ncbi:MAG TPA: sigma 54-interacting transcriptional regulator [Candidatus Polarisedimenticolaceae bacterium]
MRKFRRAESDPTEAPIVVERFEAGGEDLGGVSNPDGVLRTLLDQAARRTGAERGLVESERFGHRKGAFSGAEQDGPGKVQAAEGGTLFLDEIGDLPLELQPKLLRLLQERTYERLGDATRRNGRPTCAWSPRVGSDATSTSDSTSSRSRSRPCASGGRTSPCCCGTPSTRRR